MFVRSPRFFFNVYLNVSQLPPDLCRILESQESGKGEVQKEIKPGAETYKGHSR